MSYEVIVKALADLVVSIDLSDDETVEPGFASTVLGGAAAAFDHLSDDERRNVAEIIIRYAEAEWDGRRRNALLELPENLGLTDEEE